MITDAATELLAALSATGAAPALLRQLERAEQKTIVALALEHERARLDAITWEHGLADQLRRRGASRGLAKLVRRLEDRHHRHAARADALILLHQVRQIVRGHGDGAPIDRVRAFSPAAPAPEPPVRLASPEKWDAPPGPGQLAAFRDAVRIATMVGNPLPAGAATLRWFERTEMSADTLGITGPPGPPFGIRVASGLGYEPTVRVVAHELEHVRQMLAGRRASADRDAMEHEADVFAALVLEVWRMEQAA